VRNEPKVKRGAGRAARTLRSLILISALGVILATYNAVALHRDVGLAIGPAGPAQEQFFKDSAERPDITTFFRNLTPGGRLLMSKNIGRYTDPELAKLTGKCLDTFDPAARKALTESLASIAKVHPDAVAILLNLPGSFQQIAIATALRQAGTAPLPLVAKQFSVNDARPNAIAYLVAAGPPAIGPTLPYLADSNKDVRLAAADALGKLRARQAVEPLTRMFHSSNEDERLAYLTALAGIGDPSSEQLMVDTLRDVTLPTPHRAQAALGLGTIGTQSSLTVLWTYADDVDQSLRESAVSALQIAGDAALRLGVVEKGEEGKAAVLAVAAGIHTAYADTVIQTALLNQSSSIAAARVAGNRPDLVPILTAHAHRLDSRTQGDLVDSILRALATTVSGRHELSAMESASTQPELAALAARRASLLH
jgi:HEAT repeat protein